MHRFAGQVEPLLLWDLGNLRSKVKVGGDPRLSRIPLWFWAFVRLRLAFLAGRELTCEEASQLFELAHTRLLMGIPQDGAQTREFIINHRKVPLRRDGSITRQWPAG
jgi:hypothetical protein